GFLGRWGGNKLRDEHRKTGAAAITDEYMTSQSRDVAAARCIALVAISLMRDGKGLPAFDRNISHCYTGNIKSTHSTPPTAA
ncbi:hypothetical protein GGI12_002970, partial [Dipsacomyces acuminosporus]